MNAEERYTQEYLDAIARLKGDEEGRRAAWRRMAAGTSLWQGEPTAFSYVPRFFGEATQERFAQVTRTAYGIFAKVIARYRADEAYRREFRLDPRVEELVLLPQGYAEPLPMARIDLMLDERTGALHFCEFNTDSSSGMNETREALAALESTRPYQEFAARHVVETDVERQFSGWVRTFARIWEQSAGAQRWRERVAEEGAIGSAGVANADTSASVATDVCTRASQAGEGARPQVAIVACLDSPNPDIGELETYRTLFEQAGFACSVFDARQLAFDGERLVGRHALAGSSNVKIDCIWRFCIVVDLLDHWDEVQPFIEALRQQKVEMIGSFATQLIHDKQLFAVLRRPATQVFLNDEERAFVRDHIPQTYFLDDPALDLEAVRRNPARWVIKPTDWYESKNVVAGAETAPEEWSRLIDERLGTGTGANTGASTPGASCASIAAAAETPDPFSGVDTGDSPYLVQEFFAPHRTPTIPLYGREADFTAEPQPFGNLIGLFMHAGQFAGAYLRQGPYNVTGSAKEGIVAPVLWVAD
ncbi:MAG: hypothetical protein Q4C41_03015 [Eggerthellaceae bacterium]|nr:hypothetical protein [Eggerthellaceae bacterium]